MSGIEIVAAVFTITAGIGTCVKLTEKLVKKWRKKRKAEAEQAQRLNDLLIDEEETVKREWARVAAVRGAALTTNDENIRRSILLSKEIIDTIRAKLEQLAQNPDDDESVELGALLDMATQSQELTLEALHLAGAGNQSKLSLMSGVTLVNEPEAYPTSLSGSPEKVSQLCQAAVRYQNGKSEFVELALPQTGSTDATWECGSCSATFTHTKLWIRPPDHDHVWINAAGLMKAHCTPGKGSQYWRCIWTQRSAACELALPGKKQLLRHMLEHHVHRLSSGQTMRIDWPSESDMRQKSRLVDSCGYGIEIKGYSMQLSMGGFVINNVFQKQ